MEKNEKSKGAFRKEIKSFRKKMRERGIFLRTTLKGKQASPQAKFEISGNEKVLKICFYLN